MGLGEGLLQIQAARFTTLPTPPRFAGGMEMMENRLLGLRAALRIRGAGYGCIGGSRRYEPDAEFGRGLAWEDEIGSVDHSGVAAGKGGIGHGCPLPRFSQGSKSRDTRSPWVKTGEVHFLRPRC